MKHSASGNFRSITTKSNLNHNLLVKKKENTPGHMKSKLILAQSS
jgi:hypothetical protein